MVESCCACKAHLVFCSCFVLLIYFVFIISPLLMNAEMTQISIFMVYCACMVSTNEFYYTVVVTFVTNLTYISCFSRFRPIPLILYMIIIGCLAERFETTSVHFSHDECIYIHYSETSGVL